MEGNRARITQVVLFVTALCISTPATTKAEGPACSLALGAGKWAASFSGIADGLPVAGVNQLTVEADGNFRSTVTESWNGIIIYAKLVGKMTVDADCTGTASWEAKDETETVELGSAAIDLVFDDDMREVRFVWTSDKTAEGTAISVTLKGEGRKVFPPSRSSDQR